MSTDFGDAFRRLGDERPPGQTGEEGVFAYAWRGVERQGVAGLVALVVCWCNVWLALLAGAVGAVVGAVFGIFGGAGLFSLVPDSVYYLLPEWLAGLFTGAAVATGTGGALVGAAAGLLAGLLIGLLGPYLLTVGVAGGGSVVAALTANMLSGIVVAAAILAAAYYAESLVLRVLHGARRPSEREKERTQPVLDDLQRRMDLGNMPGMVILEKHELGAYSYMRHVGISRYYLNNLDDEELAGVLAHEVNHWRRADGLATMLVWAVAWPIIIIYSAVMFLAMLHPVTAVGAFLLGWIFWVAVRGMIVPVLGVYQRRYEYEADAAAVDTGYGDGLYSALERMQDIEPGRGGWQRSVAATHPPTELRLEAITKREQEKFGGEEREPAR